MPSNIVGGQDDIPGMIRGSKRGMDILAHIQDGHSTSANDMKPQHPSKKLKQANSCPGDFDLISEKENLHRPNTLVPRARPSRVLESLLIDAPTDCSDFECSESEVDPADPYGVLYDQRASRISDVSNATYHFDIFED